MLALILASMLGQSQLSENARTEIIASLQREYDRAVTDLRNQIVAKQREIDALSGHTERELAKLKQYKATLTEQKKFRDASEAVTRKNQAEKRQELESLNMSLQLIPSLASYLQITPLEMLSTGDLRTNAIGTFGTMKVLQVIDSTSMLAEYGNAIIIFQGASTRDTVDNATVAYKGVVRVIGTRSYTTVLRASKTVYVVEPFDTNQLRLRVAEPPAKIEEPPKSNANTTTGIPEGRKEFVEGFSDAQRQARENTASSMLAAGKRLAERGSEDAARNHYAKVIANYPTTKAAKEARTLLDK